MTERKQMKRLFEGIEKHIDNPDADEKFWEELRDAYYAEEHPCLKDDRGIYVNLRDE